MSSKLYLVVDKNYYKELHNYKWEILMMAKSVSTIAYDVLIYAFIFVSGHQITNFVASSRDQDVPCSQSILVTEIIFDRMNMVDIDGLLAIGNILLLYKLD
jgi:hypothetical protein